MKKVIKNMILLLLLQVPVWGYGRQVETKKQTGKDSAAARLVKYSDIVNDRSGKETGLFRVYTKNDRYYFEIPDSLLGVEILVVNRITKGAYNLRGPSNPIGYSGDKIGEKVVTFTKGPRDRIFLNDMYYTEYSGDSSENGMWRSVAKSNIAPLLAAFNIAAYAPDSTAALIDLTDYLNSENETFFFMPFVKSGLLGLGALQTDRSYIKEITSFPLDTEMRTVRTYAASNGMALGGYTFMTLELNSSMVRLPAKPMKGRYMDIRVGYFPNAFLDYDAHPQGVKRTSLISKWRLEPRPEDIPRYKKGEPVEPEKPIVFYIDPTTPRKWVPYLIKGIEAWNQAFEKAGFRQAIRAMEAPAGDTAWSLEDARHNAIVYKPSEIENASGPVIRDPRTGEILEAHISWYHNVLQLLHDWYFVQAGALDARAFQGVLPDSLMGKLITYVATHEVGHTLGLTHNYGASARVPTDSLRSRHWVHRHGSCPSIMDYARFNYVAQPEDSIDLDDLIPRIGVYDEWAINWGYRLFYDVSPQAEKRYLENWIGREVNQDVSLRFGSELSSSDPRNQAEDLGDDAIKSSRLGIRNLQRIKSQLIDKAGDPGDNYKYLGEMYKILNKQYVTYLGHVADNLGGAMYDPKSKSREGQVWHFVEKGKQKRALDFIDSALFNNTEWLMDTAIFALTQSATIYDVMTDQKEVLGKMLAPDILGNMFWSSTLKKDAYGAQEYLNDLTKRIFKEAVQRKNSPLTRRVLQKNYVEQLIAATKPYTGNSYGTYNFYSANVLTDVSSAVKGEARQVLGLLKAWSRAPLDPVNRLHVADLIERIEAMYKK